MKFTVESYLVFCDDMYNAQEAIIEKSRNLWERFKNVLEILKSKVTALANKIKESISKHKRFEIHVDQAKPYKWYLKIIDEIYNSDDGSAYDRAMQKYSRLEAFKSNADDAMKTNKDSTIVISETPFGRASNISKKISSTLGEVNTLMKKPDVNTEEINRLRQRIENLKFAYKLCNEAFHFLLSKSVVLKESREERKGLVTKLDRPINATPITT